VQDVVIVSTARTPIGRAYRGAFNNLTAPTLIAIAGPQHREPLAHDWHTLRLQLFG